MPEKTPEVVARAAPEMTKPAGMVRAAAVAAAEAYAQNEVEKHAQAILDAWVAQLKEQTRIFNRQVMAPKAPATGETAEIGFWSHGSPPYSWFDLYFSGPYQWAPGSAYLPNKVIRVDEPAFFLGTLWRNPAPINYILGNPSAAEMTAALNFSIWFEGVNMTTVSDGPDFVPYFPLPMPIGGDSVIGFFAYIPPNVFPKPPEGKPHLYEINLTADVTGPGPVAAGLPFSGFANWIYDPDLEPSFLYQPEQGPHWKYDIPARFLVHS